MATKDDILNYSPLHPEKNKFVSYWDQKNEEENTPLVKPTEESAQSGLNTQAYGNSEPAQYVPVTSFRDFIKKHNSFREKTDEEKEEELKREKHNAMMAAVGDGLNALHQAYSNARGVKPIAENVSLSDNMRERYEKMRKEHEANKLAYLNAYIRASQADEEHENKEREYKLKERQQTRLEEDAKTRVKKLEFDIENAKDKRELEWKKVEIQEMLANHRISVDDARILIAQANNGIKQFNAETSRMNAETRAQGNVKEVVEVDKHGNEKKITTTTTPAGNVKKPNPMSSGKKKNPMN